MTLNFALVQEDAPETTVETADFSDLANLLSQRFSLDMTMVLPMISALVPYPNWQADRIAAFLTGARLRLEASKVTNESDPIEKPLSEMAAEEKEYAIRRIDFTKDDRAYVSFRMPIVPENRAEQDELMFKLAEAAAFVARGEADQLALRNLSLPLLPTQEEEPVPVGEEQSDTE